MNIKIGFDAKRLFNNTTGLGNYSRTLVKSIRELKPDWEIHLFCANPKKNVLNEDFFDPNKYFLHTSRKKISLIWRHQGIPNIILDRGIDIYHGLSAEIPKGIVSLNCLKVVTIHDLIFNQFPDQYFWIDRLIYKLKTKEACKYSDAIVSISNATKEAIVEFLPRLSADKIEVIHQSCHPNFWQKIGMEKLTQLKEEFKLPSTYFLYVGSIIERKNLMTLIKAFALFPVDSNITLICLGSGGRYFQDIKKEVKKLGLEENVRWYKKFPFEKLPLLYKGAIASIYPSICEGFGIPVLESLCTGTFTITHNASSLKEAGGSAACLIDCSSEKEIYEAMNRSLYDSEWRESYLSQIPSHIEDFRPEKSASKYVALYEKLVKSRIVK